VSPKTQRQEHTPASVKQVAAAMAALGAYTGSNTSAEHAAEATRLGGADAYRVRLVNALLGVVQAQAVLADAVPLDEQARDAAWEEHLRSAGAGPDEVAARLELIRWQVLRSATPLRQMARNRQVGPIPLAAAHAAEALQVLLGVIAASQDAVATGDVTTLAAQTSQLRTAREAMSNALANTDLLLNMLRSVGL
jgi:Family of unknown function (DUF6245)